MDRRHFRVVERAASQSVTADDVPFAEDKFALPVRLTLRGRS
jgi:hypothetical protein